MADRGSILSRLRLALAAVSAASPQAPSTAASAPPPDPAASGTPVPARPAVPSEWLDRRISVEEAEAANPGITDDRVLRVPEAARPFGFNNAEWEALKRRMMPGDELWTFASSSDSWQHLAGRAGIALVRDGVAIESMVTMMN